MTSATMRRFKTEPMYVIREMEMTSNQCLVLPKSVKQHSVYIYIAVVFILRCALLCCVAFSSSLTKAFIFSASHHLPVSPEFPNYDKLRLHWKKQVPFQPCTYAHMHKLVQILLIFWYKAVFIVKHPNYVVQIHIIHIALTLLTVYVTGLGKIGLNAAPKVFYFILPVGCTGPWDAVLLI